ncbi:hypothetical protein Trydic_g16459 [Trypoxylus dichotomus]
MKEPDEVAVAPSGDENCVSSLIGTVLSLIISILVWLQNVGCKGGNTECVNTCDLNTALQQLTVYAKKADELGPSVSGSKTKKLSLKKDDSKKNLKKAKSGENRSVMYAVDQNENLDPACRRCCKKVVEPKERKDDNVIFEVVAAQMVEVEMQTDVAELVDNFTETDDTFQRDEEPENTVEYISVAVQVSQPSLTDEIPRSEIETKEVGIQAEIIVEKEVKDEVCECEIIDKDTNIRFKDDACLDCDATDADYDEDDEDEDYLEPREPDWLCPDECPQYIQHMQAPGHRQSAQYRKGQIRQDRPSYYPGYEPPMYNGYNERYAPRDVYGPMRYVFPPPQPYYQKITRTIHRGSPLRTADYQNHPRRQMSPTQRPLSQNVGVDQVSQSVQSPLSSIPPTGVPVSAISPRISKNESLAQREQSVNIKECVPSCPGSKIIQVPNDCLPSCPGSKIKPVPQVSLKDCLPNCPGNKPNPVRKLIATPPNPISPHQKPGTPAQQQADKGDVSKSSSKKCVAKCANGNKNQSNQQKPALPPKDKPRPVALMPKGAIPVEPRDVLQVEEAPTKQEIVVPDSVMSVEANKRIK